MLTRREREEIEKQEATRKYQALHAAGKTEEAREGVLIQSSLVVLETHNGLDFLGTICVPCVYTTTTRQQNCHQGRCHDA